LWAGKYNTDNNLYYCPDEDSGLSIYSKRRGVHSVVDYPDADNLYRYNYITIGIQEYLDWGSKGLKVCKIVAPSNKIVGGDARSYENPNFRGVGAFSYSYNVAPRHGVHVDPYNNTLRPHPGKGFANLRWADGHVSSESTSFLNKWYTPASQYSYAKSLLSGMEKPQ
jgi:prepilin-type processing-associated H-X9-DG protein